jgi:hypothetical protein
MEKKMKKVIVFSSEKVFYRTEMEVPEGASDDEISQMFFDIMAWIRPRNLSPTTQ